MTTPCRPPVLSREVARHDDANLVGDGVVEAKHGGVAVLLLHDLVATHVAGLIEAKRVHSAQRVHTVC